MCWCVGLQVTFDASMMETYGTLMAGGSLHMVIDEQVSLIRPLIRRIFDIRSGYPADIQANLIGYPDSRSESNADIHVWPLPRRCN